MRRLKNSAVNQALKLEVRAIDKTGEYFFVNKINANYYDKELNLLKKDMTSLFITELYFSRDEELENDCNLIVSDITSLIINDEQIELTVDMQDDNINIDRYEIEFLENKILVFLYISDTNIEPLDDIPFIEFSVSFNNNKDEDEIADFIYDDFKEEISRDLNIKTRADFIASLSEENTRNYTCDYIVQKLKLMSSKNLSSFIEQLNSSNDLDLGSR